jgi:hypothetical protein
LRFGNEYGQKQDLDARRIIKTKIRRSKSNNNKKHSEPVIEFAVTSFEKKRKLNPAAIAVGLFFVPHFALSSWSE